MRFNEWTPPEIEHGKLSKWNWMIYHPENIKIGEKVDIGAFTFINAKHGVELKKNVQIGSHCSIYSISTIDQKKGEVIIGENSAIGSHSTIMPGISIGANCIIGAHSFVNKDIPCDSIAFGIPAKVIRSNKKTQKKVYKREENKK